MSYGLYTTLASNKRVVGEGTFKFFMTAFFYYSLYTLYVPHDKGPDYETYTALAYTLYSKTFTYYIANMKLLPSTYQLQIWYSQIHVVQQLNICPGLVSKIQFCK